MIIIYISQTRETESGSAVRKKPAYSGQNQAHPAEKLPHAPKLAEGGQSSVSMESVTLQLSELRDELKKKEKVRALQIAKVDSPVISHIKFLIPSPPETEVSETRNRLDGILSAAAGVVSPEEEKRIRAEFEDYFSCGKTKYKIRTLSVDVRHNVEPSITGTVTMAQEIEYGTDPRTGVPWQRNSGSSSHRQLNEKLLLSRYGHLYQIADESN